MSEKEINEFIDRFLTNYPGQGPQEPLLRILIKNSKLNRNQMELIETLSACIAREISADELLRFQRTM